MMLLRTVSDVLLCPVGDPLSISAALDPLSRRTAGPTLDTRHEDPLIVTVEDNTV